jgi:serine/threonine protein kinase
MEVKGLGKYIFLEPACAQTSLGAYHECWDTNTWEALVVKIINSNHQYEAGNFSIDTIDTTVEEIKGRNIQHPNIVQIIDKSYNSPKLYIFQKYHSQKTLRALMDKITNGGVGVLKATLIVTQLFNALKHIDDTCQIRITQLPMSSIIVDDVEETHVLLDYNCLLNKDNKKYTVYTAPEDLLNEAYDFKACIWCLGVIYYELVFGKPPWENEITELKKPYLKRLKDEPETALQFDEGNVMDDTDELVILKRMLVYDPESRISKAELDKFLNSKPVASKTESMIEKEASMKDTHSGITCEGCQRKDFRGLRYANSAYDINFCQNCFEKDQSHIIDPCKPYKFCEIDFPIKPSKNVYNAAAAIKVYCNVKKTIKTEFICSVCKPKKTTGFIYKSNQDSKIILCEDCANARIEKVITHNVNCLQNKHRELVVSELLYICAPPAPLNRAGSSFIGDDFSSQKYISGFHYNTPDAQNSVLCIGFHKQTYENARFESEFLGDLQIYNDFKSAYIPRVLGYHINIQQDNVCSMEIKTDYLGTSTLEEMKVKALPLHVKFHLIQQIVQAVKILHKHKYWHDYLKPSCIFVSKDYNVKLGGLEIKKWVGGFTWYDDRVADEFADPITRDEQVMKVVKGEGEFDVFSVGMIINWLFNGSTGQTKYFKKMIEKCKSKRLFRWTIFNIDDHLEEINDYITELYKNTPEDLKPKLTNPKNFEEYGRVFENC